MCEGNPFCRHSHLEGKPEKALACPKELRPVDPVFIAAEIAEIDVILADPPAPPNQRRTRIPALPVLQEFLLFPNDLGLVSGVSALVIQCDIAHHY